MLRTSCGRCWRWLASKRCYGIVGDALNPVIDALRRNGKIEFIHVRHEEYGVFAAVADAYLSGNPAAVTGLLGYGGAYKAIHDADLLLMLGTDFPFPEFLPGNGVKKVQIDRNPKHIGRRTAVDLGLVGDIRTTVAALLGKLSDKTDSRFLEKHVAETNSFHELLQHYVEKGPGIKPIRPEFLAATLSELADDDALFFVDTGTACIWAARHIKGYPNRRIFGSFSWASMANAAPNAFGVQLAFPGRQTIALCGDGGFTMLALGDLLTQVQRKSPVVQIILNNESLDFVNIEMQEAGVVPFGVDFKNPNFAKVAEAIGAKGIRIEDPGDVREGIAVALTHQGGPVVVDVVVDPYALSLPSHIPFHTARGFTLSLAKQVWSGKMDSVIKTIKRNTGLV
jgi:pyruvate dehydrogenase (quinone)